MPLQIDFGIVPQAIELRAKRAALIANNLSNADTPGFKAQDIDFRQVLSESMESSGAKDMDGFSMKTTHPGHGQFGAFIGDNDMSFGADHIQYRNASQASVDGNTVDTQMEKSAFAENQLRYQTSVNYLDGMVRNYRKALTGN